MNLLIAVMSDRPDEAIVVAVATPDEVRAMGMPPGREFTEHELTLLRHQFAFDQSDDEQEDGW